MEYKYRCISRFPVLLMIGENLTTIRPNQVIEVNSELNYSVLKKIVEKSNTPKKQYKPRATKTNTKKVVKDGNNNKT